MALTDFEIRRYQQIVDEFLNEYSPINCSGDMLNCYFEGPGKLVVELFSLLGSATEVGGDKVMAEFSEADRLWSIYFKDSKQQWRTYDPLSKVKRLNEFLNEIRFFISNRLILRSCS